MADGGEDFRYADEESSGEKDCHKDRRKKDDISTSDNKEHIDIEKAWDTLKFQIYRYSVKKATNPIKALNEKDVTEYMKKVDILKLQYALKSKVAKSDFTARLTEKFECHVVSAGVVLFSGDFVEKSEIPALWGQLISFVNDALERNIVQSMEFQNKSELENFLQKVNYRTKNLIEKGLVGIFVSNDDRAVIGKFVGAQEDVNKITQELKHAMAIEKKSGTSNKAEFGHYEGCQESFKKREFDQSIDISEDQDIYFSTMKLDNELHEKFPHVTLTKEGNDNKTYKFICPDENELKKAISWLHDCMGKMFLKELKFSNFLQNDNVQVYLQKCLRDVPAALRVFPDKIYLLCHKKLLETSENVIADHIKDVEIEGFWSPMAEQIRGESHGKIQFYQVENSGKKIVYYTKDVYKSAMALVKELQKYRHKEEGEFSKEQINGMKALGVIDGLQEKYKDILIRTKDSNVILQGPDKNNVAACLEELDAHVKQMEFVQLTYLPELAQELLQKDESQFFVTQKLKSKIAFSKEGKRVTRFIFMKNEKSKSCICMEIQNCFVEKNINKKCLENVKGKTFTRKHSGKVAVSNQGSNSFCSICFTEDLYQEIQGVLYSYSKSCTAFVKDFLLSFGDRCLKEIEKNHAVGIELDNERICIKEPYEGGKDVVTEIESHVSTTVLHFGELDYRKKVLLATDQNQIDSIAKSYKCCWKPDVFPFESTQTKDKGIEYLCTWNLPNRRKQISIAEIDYKTAQLDGLIILVNECLYGEDIFGTGGRLCPVQTQQSVLKIGDSKETVLQSNYVRLKCLALVTSDSGLTGKTQTRQYINAIELKKFCSGIFAKMLSERKYKVGFALPTEDPNLIGKLDTVIEAFQDINTTQFYDNMPDSELIFGVKTEAERWMQEVDNTLKYTPYARRNISPRYKGLLNSPCTSVEIAKKSILETGAKCIVVAISTDLDLSKGFVSNLVSKACGEQLKAELSSKCKKPPKLWDLVICQSYNLAEKGIQKVIFGFIPHWKQLQKIQDLEVFIEDCLLLADSAGCSTVAFPALGTGKLKYPYRDVAVALFNGVNKYVAEGTIGGISTVYISVPKEEVNIHQILEREQKRKKSAETSYGKQDQADGQTYFVAENGCVKYSIITESVCEKVTSGKFVNIKFEQGDKSYGNPVQNIHFSNLWELNVKCVTTGDGLKQRVQDVVKFCEDQKITCVNIFCSHVFKKISEAEQAVIISQSIEDPQNHEYLKNVRIVVSDDAIHTLCSLMSSGMKVSKKSSYIPWNWGYSGNAQISLDWKTASYHSPKTTQCLNVTLAGCKHSDIERAKVDITQYIEGIEYYDIDPDTILDLVSAELNPGIAKHLVQHKDPNDFEKWKKDLSKFFNVYFWINKDIPKIEIWGSFDSILQTEQYFENEFPMSPLKSEIGLLETHDQHYQPESVQEAYQKTKLTNEQVKCMEVSFEFEKATYKFKELEMTVLCHDITDIEVDCIVSPVNRIVSTETGVAKVIAVKAGEYYKRQCKAIGDKRSLGITECVETRPGQLQKCKYVIHVHSPQRFEANRMPEQLLEIEKSVTNCLKKADQLRMTTIAIPFLGTGTSKFPIDHCGIQYYRAVYAFKDAETLKKVILVDIMQDKVIKVCSEISKCTSKSTNLLDAVLAVKTSKSCVRYHFAHKQMHEVDTDAVVMKVDKNLNGQGEDMKLILGCATGRFQDIYKEQSRISHACTTVVPIQADLVGLQWKYVFFAVIPVLKDDPENYEHFLNITVQHILQYASQRDISDITLPILSCEDDPFSLDLCCKAMISSVLQYGHQTNRKVKCIQFLSRDSKALTTLMLAMLEQLKNGKIKVAY